MDMNAVVWVFVGIIALIDIYLIALLGSGGRTVRVNRSAFAVVVDDWFAGNHAGELDQDGGEDAEPDEEKEKDEGEEEHEEEHETPLDPDTESDADVDTSESDAPNPAIPVVTADTPAERLARLQERSLSDETVIGRWVQLATRRRASIARVSETELADVFDDMLCQRDDLLRTMTHNLTGVGLLGTFLGLFLALKAAVSTISAAGAMGDTSVTTQIQALQNLYPVMSGMAVAFVTSIAGLSSALLLGYATSRQARSRSGLKEAMLAFASVELLPALTPQDSAALTLDKFDQSVDRLGDTLGSFGGLTTEVSRVANEAKGLSDTVEQVGMIVSEWTLGYPEMSRVIESFDDSIGILNDRLGSLTESSEKTQAGLDAVSEALGALNTHINGQQTAMHDTLGVVRGGMSDQASHAERLATLVQQVGEGSHTAVTEVARSMAASNRQAARLDLLVSALERAQPPRNITTLLPRFRAYLFPRWYGQGRNSDL